MRDVDELLRALDGPRAPIAAPPWPRRRPRWVYAAGALAAAAAALVAVGFGGTSLPGIRGFAGDTPTFDLRMVVERGGVAVRVAGGSLHTGERVLFRAAATSPTLGVVWVEGPRGAESIASVEVDGVPRDVGDGGGLAAYRFDRPGRYVFHLSSAVGQCVDCPTIPVEVR